jgi:3-phytase
MGRIGRTLVWFAIAASAVEGQSVLSTQPNEPEQVEAVQVSQEWESSGDTYGETDSLAAWRSVRGRVLVAATAKEGDYLQVFDGRTGEFLRRIGERGSGNGQLAYPNGIVAIDRRRLGGGPIRKDIVLKAKGRKNALLVVERDNSRVQAFSPDTGESLGSFGQDVLHLPYGAAISYQQDDTYLFVTDTEVKPEETVKVFRLRNDGPHITGEFVRSFGDTEGDGRITEAESIAIDDMHDQVLLCDEGKARHNVKVYRRDGTFTGCTLAGDLIRGDPEGIVVFEQGEEGVIILTDQRKTVSIWHVFDRQSHEHLGAFTGKPVVANTDGICLFANKFEGFPLGAMFAVNNDADIRCYCLATILEAISRETLCSPKTTRSDKLSP